MDSTTYVDLFATKGAEYLFVLGFLAVLTLFWYLLNKPAATARAVGAMARSASPAEWFRLAQKAFYHPGHTWAVPEGNGVVRIGIDDFAQKLVGTGSALDLPAPGDHLDQGAVGLRLVEDGKSVALLAPVNGEVVAVNEEAQRSPELINEDPYGRGWLLRVRAPRIQSDLKNLLRGRLAHAWMELAEDTLRKRMSRQYGVAFQDGGVLLPGIAKNLSPEHWDEIASEFLLSK